MKSFCGFCALLIQAEGGVRKATGQGHDRNDAVIWSEA